MPSCRSILVVQLPLCQSFSLICNPCITFTLLHTAECSVVLVHQYEAAAANIATDGLS